MYFVLAEPWASHSVLHSVSFKNVLSFKNNYKVVEQRLSDLASEPQFLYLSNGEYQPSRRAVVKTK